MEYIKHEDAQGIYFEGEKNGIKIKIRFCPHEKQDAVDGIICILRSIYERKVIEERNKKQEICNEESILFIPCVDKGTSGS